MFGAAHALFSEHAAQREREVRDLSLDRSYRSTPPVLELVDAVMAGLGPDAIGLDRPFTRHESGANRKELPGRVTLLAPVTMDEARAETAEESWVADSKLLFARRLAAQVRAWIDDPPWVATRGRPLRPEDILVLLRSRGELASLIVARLHAEGVPVAGIDRLLLTDPLAIQDLLSALRFALQPDDDLNLATLLVSPLFGWSQEMLFMLAKGRKNSLWSTLRDRQGEFPDTVEAIGVILAQSDLVTPYQLLESLLSGPLEARRKILARLGEEARDPIDEFLNRALEFEASHAPSLQHFIDWFESGEAIVKRDAEAPLDAVRVMTVHGAKGLQAPYVILADATRDPENTRIRSIDIALGERDPVPIPRPRKVEQIGPLAAAVAEKKNGEREEHWRLLYVAMTRAEEHLVIGGALGIRGGDAPPPESWYSAAEQAMEGLGCGREDSDLWRQVRMFAGLASTESRGKRESRKKASTPELAKPDWLDRPAPDEERPPRPLAPSALGPDAVANVPPGDAMRMAAERGKILHRLFERLPDLPLEERRASALRWLEQSAGVADMGERELLVQDALDVIDHRDFAEFFSTEALAEAPLAAVVDGIVVSGTVDRLLVGKDVVRVVDFKTGSHVPEGAEAVPNAHLRQMAAYVAALKTIFPEHHIEAALLYSTGPRIISLSPEILAAHKPSFADIQESLSPLG